MARSALQFFVRQQKAKKGNRKSEINDLVSKGVLQPLIGEWSHEVRKLANDSAHPEVPDSDQDRTQPAKDPTPPPPDPQDARDIVKFLDFLLFYLYDLPAQIKAGETPYGVSPASLNETITGSARSPKWLAAGRR